MKKIYESPITRIEIVESEDCLLAPYSWRIKGDDHDSEHGGHGLPEVIGGDDDIHDGDEITG